MLWLWIFAFTVVLQVTGSKDLWVVLAMEVGSIQQILRLPVTAAWMFEDRNGRKKQKRKRKSWRQDCFVFGRIEARQTQYCWKACMFELQIQLLATCRLRQSTMRKSVSQRSCPTSIQRTLRITLHLNHRASGCNHFDVLDTR